MNLIWLFKIARHLRQQLIGCDADVDREAKLGENRVLDRVRNGDTGVLLDLDQVRVLRQSLRLLRSRQLDVQDTILELCVDVFLLHIAHVETARAGWRAFRTRRSRK